MLELECLFVVIGPRVRKACLTLDATAYNIWYCDVLFSSLVSLNRQFSNVGLGGEYALSEINEFLTI